MSSLREGMRWLIELFYHLTEKAGLPSYGIAIILMTIFVKTILYPLTLKQMKSMKKMQLLQPKIKEIQEKHKNDPQKAQVAVMELYKTHGANPITGCLPLIIQMPIFISLYQALSKFTFTGNSSFLWLHTLQAPDKLYILPILAGASTFLQQKLSTTNVTDPTQRTMLMVMPVLFFWIASKAPAGLSLYWVVFSVVGAIQQYFINKQPVELKEEVVIDEGSDKKRKNR